MPQLLSLCSTANETEPPSPRAPTTEAHALRACAPREAHAQGRVAPRSPQLEKVHAQQRRPNVAKNK